MTKPLTLRVLRWALGVGLVALAVGAFLAFLFSRGRARGLGQVAVRSIEDAWRPVIAERQAELERLETDLEANAKRIEQARVEVQRKTDILSAVYTTVGMTPEEVVERLKGLTL